MNLGVAACPICGAESAVLANLLAGYVVVRCRADGKQTAKRAPAKTSPIETAPWRSRARNELLRLAGSGVEFSADDVTKAIGMPEVANELGGLFVWAQRAGYIERVGVTTGDNPQRHGGSQGVWRGR